MIAYYLENEKTSDYVAEGEREFESATRLSETNPDLFARQEAARRQNEALPIGRPRGIVFRIHVARESGRVGPHTRGVHIHEVDLVD